MLAINRHFYHPRNERESMDRCAFEIQPAHRFGGSNTAIRRPKVSLTFTDVDDCDYGILYYYYYKGN